MARFSKPKIGVKFPALRRGKKNVATDVDYGKAGNPVSTSNPFYFGFMVTAGALIAFTLLQALASASAVFILIII